MFNSRVLLIKMSKMAHFLYFLLKTAKKIVPVWIKFLNAFKTSYLALLRTTMDYWVLN